MIWEIDDKKKVIEGLDEDGNPDPEYAAKLGLVAAPYGRRALASIIEFVLYGLLISPYVIFVVPYLVNILTGMLDVYGFVQHPSFILILLVWLFSFVLTLAFMIVQVSLHGKKGVTIGKAFVGIRSVNVKTLEAPGFWRAVWRALLMSMVFYVPIIGPALFFVSPFFDQQRRRRGWLDYAGGTWFVDIRRGLNPYDRKRMRIARKNAKVELNDDEEQLPSLATEAVEREPVQYVPSARRSGGVLGASVPEPSPSAPASTTSQNSPPAPAAPAPSPAAPVSAPSAARPIASVPQQAEPYRPGSLSGREPSQQRAQPPQSPTPQAPPQTPPPHAAPPQVGRQPASEQYVPRQPSVPPPGTPGQEQPSPHQQQQPAPVQPSAPSSAPPVVPGPLDGDTVMHASPGLEDDVAETRIAGRRSAAVATIALDTGETFELEGSALLGRNPRAGADENIAHALPIADPSHSISKTHLLLEVNGSKVFAVDRHSTNGSSLERSGQVVNLPPGLRVELFGDDIVRFGDRSLRFQFT
ncbi:MAG TPA: RDD family protein [Candidatus Agrococcus pullicola]|uniref:RDD family protein n=1 Tax=Candidatus Agrococcus pullicola TaxID=2838429 RepID=A0A9D2C9F4_9MICO|nr:RDD family protein [Candidatus Agrococcus pullicola]